MATDFGETICYFCESAPRLEGGGRSVRIYLVESRRYKSVSYRYLDVSVPRCKDCQDIHRKRVSRLTLRIITGVCAIVFAMNLYPSMFRWLTSDETLVLSVLTCALALLIKVRFEKDFEDAGVKSSRKNALVNFAPLKNCLDSGWTFSKPTP